MIEIEGSTQIITLTVDEYKNLITENAELKCELKYLKLMIHQAANNNKEDYQWS